MAAAGAAGEAVVERAVLGRLHLERTQTLDRNVSSGLEIGGETCFLAFDLRLSCVHAGNDKIFVKKFTFSALF